MCNDDGEDEDEEREEGIDSGEDEEVYKVCEDPLERGITAKRKKAPDRSSK